VGANFEGGGGKEIFNPNISPNFGNRELKIYIPLDLHEPHLSSEFPDPNPKNGAWRGEDRRNKKIQLFGRVPNSHQNLSQGVKGT